MHHTLGMKLQPLGSPRGLDEARAFAAQVARSPHISCTSLHLQARLAQVPNMAMTGEARAIIVTNSVFLVLAWISVCLRLVARKKYGNTLGADDYYIIAAWVWIFHRVTGSCQGLIVSRLFQWRLSLLSSSVLR